MARFEEYSVNSCSMESGRALMHQIPSTESLCVLPEQTGRQQTLDLAGHLKSSGEEYR
jgi:hypothetical protein